MPCEPWKKPNWSRAPRWALKKTISAQQTSRNAKLHNIFWLPLNSGIRSSTTQSASSKPNARQWTGNDLVVKTEMQAFDNMLFQSPDFVGTRLRKLKFQVLHYNLICLRTCQLRSTTRTKPHQLLQNKHTLLTLKRYIICRISTYSIINFSKLFLQFYPCVCFRWQLLKTLWNQLGRLRTAVQRWALLNET